MFNQKKVLSAVIAVGLLLSLGTPVSNAAPKNLARAVVQPDWLEQNLDDPKVRIIEVSTEPGVYERGHIKNAIKFVWHTDLVDTVNRDIYGIEDVRLLDGGRVKWEKDARALTTAVPTFQPGNFNAKSRDRSLRANLIRDVLPVAKKRAKADLIDIRSADEYSGKIFAPAGFQELAVRAGHIPGAINVPWGQNVNADGTFKTVAELKKLYADKGVDGKQNIITYCRIGERSSLTWFVLSEILGYNVKNYDGSWTEYGNSVGAPISNPAGTIWGAS